MTKIVPVDQLQPAFDNALLTLQRTHIHECRTVGSLVRAWKEHYDCYLLHDQFYVWESVGFKDEHQLTWFLLKWS